MPRKGVLVAMELELLSSPYPHNVPLLSLDSTIPILDLEKEILQHIIRLRITKLPMLLERFEMFVVSGFGSRKKKALADITLSLDDLNFKRGMKIVFKEKPKLESQSGGGKQLEAQAPPIRMLPYEITRSCLKQMTDDIHKNDNNVIFNEQLSLLYTNGETSTDELVDNKNSKKMRSPSPSQTEEDLTGEDSSKSKPAELTVDVVSLLDFGAPSSPHYERLSSFDSFGSTRKIETNDAKDAKFEEKIHEIDVNAYNEEKDADGAVFKNTVVSVVSKLVLEESQKPFHVYEIQFEIGSICIDVAERYSQLLRLHKAINDSSKKPLPEFPPKRFVGKLSTKTVQQRIEKLKDYFQVLIMDPDLLCCEHFLNFLQLDESDLAVVENVSSEMKKMETSYNLVKQNFSPKSTDSSVSWISFLKSPKAN